MADVAEQGCYDLRGPDFETMLIGPITNTMIDADRLVRLEWDNGIPNWDIYRSALAGDTLYRERVRLWCVAFAIAHTQEAQPRAFSDEFACLVGWDAYYALLHNRFVASVEDVADAAGVSPVVYRKARNAVTARLRASLWEYWVRLQVAFRQVVLWERKQEGSARAGVYGKGRGFDADSVGGNGDGCFIATPLNPSY